MLTRASRVIRAGFLCVLLLVALGLWALVSRPVRAAAQPRPAAASRPTLVVMLVVDQMRADYVLQYGHQWTGGLRRLLEGGAWFQQAVYPYAYTVTCAGHATISTGSFPHSHGITGNSWWDRDSNRVVECADDPAVQSISYGQPVRDGKSAARLAIPTFTDNLRAQSAVAPRIVTMSMKERTAIMLAGHAATAATWYDAGTGSLVTSTAFTQSPVPFVERFVKAHPIDAQLGAAWTPDRAAPFYLYSDAASWERPPAFWTTTFPHPLTRAGMKAGQSYEAWEESPFSDAYLEALAETAIRDLQLGKGPGIDYLGVSFSALDLVGHDFGPQSHEVQDVLLRLDSALASLFAALDRAVGRSRYVVALAGDHGVSPIPEQLRAQNIPAGRISMAPANAAVEDALRPALGGGKAIARTSGGQIFLTTEARAALARDTSLRDGLLDRLARMPGVGRALFTADRDRWDPADAIARAVAYTYFPGRAGDVFVVPQPYWLFGEGSAASHGTPYRYDTWVPVFLYGNGIKAGRYTQAISPADIAPTLAWVCGVTLPHPEGRPLVEATVPAPASTTPYGTGRHSTR